MVTITRSKDLKDEIKRANCLQAIEKAATTGQLVKLQKLTKNTDMIALLDSIEL